MTGRLCIIGMTCFYSCQKFSVAKLILTLTFIVLFYGKKTKQFIKAMTIYCPKSFFNFIRKFFWYQYLNEGIFGAEFI